MQKGFTLVELIVIIGIFFSLAVFGVSTYRSVGGRNDVILATQTIAQAHRTAHTLARSMAGDTSWGVNILTGEVVVFRGASYVSRDTENDLRYSLSPWVVITGETEIVYAKLSGRPNNTGDIQVILDNETHTITINEQGTILY